MKLALIGLIALSGVVDARNLFTPLTLRKDYLWYPFLECDEEENDRCFDVRLWGAGFNRTATRATGKDNYNTTNDGTQVGCDNKEIAKLFFAKSPFYLQNAFANNEIVFPADAIDTNPLLNFAKVSPHLAYSETGVMFGFEISAQVPSCERWNWGIRGTIPFVNRNVEQLKCCSELIDGAALSDVVQTGVYEKVGSNSIGSSFAVRLDIATALKQDGVNTASPSLVLYSSSTVKINNVDIGADQTLAPSVHVIGSSTGTLPAYPFSATVATVAAATAVDGAGSNIGNGSRGRFVNPTDYSALGASSTAQSQLFIVPTLNAAGTATSALAQNIIGAILARINSFDADVADFLAANGITFDSQRVQGPGNLDLEAFLNYQFCCPFFLEGRVGLTLPTDNTTNEPGKLFLLPTGNNGHVEVDLGLAGGWDMCDWAKLYGDLSYNWVLNSSECVAGSFTNATVKNIGPKTEANISWQYFLAHIDLTIIPPCLKCIGFDLGYEFYWKRKDDVDFCKNSIADLVGTTNTLNSCVIEKATKVISNKLSVEIFTVNSCVDFFGGFSQVVGGKNVMRETEWHIGMAIKF
ncbi:hypothetical protein A3F06_00900 [candidate division TM6 bacterium RIFCSPHIGHO2_12_FULL_36_22]|nr:MAG: hypothetical protein A3F06_00900 [candidate division TM6 bacterium RIFCSPHIGHO2_12_FULL_36_22]